MQLHSDKILRDAHFELVQSKLEHYYSNTKQQPVSAKWDIELIRNFAQAVNLESGSDATKVYEHVLKGLTDFAVHTPHPNYLGLFNPRANFPSIVADLITATFNPQLAAWSHAPFANEIENFLVREFGRKFGYAPDTTDGTFCTGGAESNLTAVICALNKAILDFQEKGIGSIGKQVVIYCSSAAHHSIVKAAKITGLGTQSVRPIATQPNRQIDVEALKQQIVTDQENDCIPLMIVGTAGTTGEGAIDDLQALRTIANAEEAWFHVDAAYGGAITISERYKRWVAGIELSDSITLDLHKWFSIPMGASLFLTSHKTILHQSFAVRTDYMPEDGNPDEVVDPYVHSVQWSRRFIGLKMYLPLAIYGWEGYEQLIDTQVELGQALKAMLQERGWEIVNDSSLPILCFSRETYEADEMTTIVDAINDSGKAWLSVYPINGRQTARVCITNYLTGQRELEELIALLEVHKI